MIQRHILHLKTSLSKFLSERSVIRHHQYPTRTNTIQALLYLLGVAPLAILATPWFVLRMKWCGPIRTLVLATEGEFGPFVQLMEFARGEFSHGAKNQRVLVLSRYRHALCDLYESELKCKVIAGSGASRMRQQIILLQPNSCVEIIRLTYGQVVNKHLPALSLPTEFTALRSSIQKTLQLPTNRYIAVALHTLQYDIDNNPQYEAKESSLESLGSDLSPAIDQLQSQGLSVILLGSLDTGRSQIPRDIPRLTNFAKLGGPEEVALASGCEYFWTDNVGAWWLGAPFNKRVLYTNLSRTRIRSLPFADGTLFLPVRFQTRSGRDLVFSELFELDTSPYKLVSHGELRMIRNSPNEICDAHHEMLARIGGYWADSEHDIELQERFSCINARYPGSHQLKLASVFLNNYPHLLN